MNKLQIIDNAIAVKRVFGSFAILDQFEEYEIPEVIQFARIIENYLTMTHKLEEINKIENAKQIFKN
jgi:hypothetical protein